MPEEPDTQPEIVIVDDDPSVLRALSRQIALMGYAPIAFANAAQAVDCVRAGRGSCLLLDLQMPEMSGLDVQDLLAGIPVPIVFVSGHATIPVTVQAMQNGAVTFLEKPVEYAELSQAIEDALEQGAELKSLYQMRSEASALYASLTDRQKDVFNILITGAPNKVIAHSLGISERTVKAHRFAIMDRLGANSIADVYKLAAVLEIDSPDEAG